MRKIGVKTACQTAETVRLLEARSCLEGVVP